EPGASVPEEDASDVVPGAKPDRRRRTRRAPRRHRFITSSLAIVMILALAAGALAMQARIRSLADRSRALSTSLGAARSDLTVARADAVALGSEAAALRTAAGLLRGEIAAAEAAKVRTVVRTKTVTKH